MNATMNNTNNNNKSEREMNFSESKDEVDFVRESIQNNNNYNNNISTDHKTTLISNECSKYNNTNNNTNNNKSNNTNTNTNTNNNSKTTVQNSVPNKETNSSKKKKNENDKKTMPKERLSLFSFNKKISQKQNSSTKTTAAATSDTTINTNITTKTTTTAPTTSIMMNNTNSDAVNKQNSGFAENLAVIPAIASLTTTAVPRQHKFVKSSSLSRLLGNTYNAKKFEKEEQKRLANDGKFNTYSGRRRRLSGPTLERFRQCSKDDGDIVNGEATLDLRDLYGGSRNDLLSLEHPEEEDRSNVDFGTKAMRTISRGLGKLWWRRSHSVEISTPDPEFKVSYLGNVLTGWAKGEGCVEKQLNTLWRNYTQNTKPDVVMRIKVCASGLKATTRQHGLTEYWANRITHCCAPKNYPRVFCWIYRHEGRKLKHELRCHAVLCSKEKIVQDICSTLKENLECALREFKRDKILKQNARLSLANAAYDNPSLPRRKILLSVGGNNYRPPLERSKSAPKLMAIEEAIGEEEGEDIEETNEPEMRACCQKDSLYPAMTLGRRRCRRGHSIRRTGQARVPLCEHFANAGRLEKLVQPAAAASCCSSSSAHTKEQHEEDAKPNDEQRHSYGSDDFDDFEKLLKGNNYDSGNSLANELMPYFDMQLNKQISCSLGSLSELQHNEDMAGDEGEPLSLLPTINSNPSADPTAEYSLDGHQNEPESPELLVGLRRNGVCSDGEEDYLDADDMYFRQASIFNMMHRNSMRKMAQLSLSSDESSIDTNSSMQYHHQIQSSISSNASSTATSVSAAEANAQHDAGSQQKCLPMDSDEGSISSGCETASTVTANQDDTSLRYRQSKLLPPVKQLSSIDLELHPEEDAPPISVEEIYQRLESRMHGRHGSDATTFSSSSSITLKLGASPTSSLKGFKSEGNSASSTRSRKVRRQAVQHAGGDSDSECSDESGYVEYQERETSTARPVVMQATSTKPQPPPKPATRRIIGVASKVGTTTVV